MKQKEIGLLLSIAAGQIPHIGPSGITLCYRKASDAGQNTVPSARY